MNTEIKEVDSSETIVKSIEEKGVLTKKLSEDTKFTDFKRIYEVQNKLRNQLTQELSLSSNLEFLLLDLFLDNYLHSKALEIKVSYFVEKGCGYDTIEHYERIAAKYETRALRALDALLVLKKPVNINILNVAQNQVIKGLIGKNTCGSKK